MIPLATEQIKGISCYAKELLEKGESIDKDIISFIENSLFTTLTHVMDIQS